MKIQSLSVVVPNKECMNKCPFCVARMVNSNIYENHPHYDINAGFHNWMASAMAADWYEKHGRPIPRRWQIRLDKARDWLRGLSAEDYDRLIH